MTGIIESCSNPEHVTRIEWEVVATMPPSPGQSRALGLAGAVIGVHRDLLLIGGGANFPDSMPWAGGKKKYYDDVYVYSQKDRQLVYHRTTRLPAKIAYAASCSTSNGVFYGGGENEDGLSRQSSLIDYDITTNSLRVTKLPDLPVAVTNAAAATLNNIVYVAGGETAEGASSLFFSLNLSNHSNGWQTMPGIPVPMSHSVLLALANDKHASLYLAGGRSKKQQGGSDFYSYLFEFDTSEGKWKEKKALPYPVSAGTGIATADKNLLFFGGDRGETFRKVESMIDSINNETDDTRKQELVEAKTRLQASHPGFSKTVLHYNTIRDQWTDIGNVPFDVPVTTTAIQWGKYVLIPTGEIRAGVRTARILKGTIKE